MDQLIGKNVVVRMMRNRNEPGFGLMFSGELVSVNECEITLVKASIIYDPGRFPALLTTATPVEAEIYQPTQLVHLYRKNAIDYYEVPWLLTENF